ncbi:MAG: hypothetical protein LKI59_04345 [Bacteroidales bacterium]|nr:hypothetical protein [Bacteroidales bacterium]
MNFFCLALSLAVLLLPGCSRIRNIRVLSYNVKSLEITGLRSVNGVIAVDIDNPASEFTVSDIKGVVKYGDNVIAEYSGGPLTVKARSSGIRYLHCKFSISKDVSLSDIFSMAGRGDIDNYTTDVSLRFRRKPGLGRKFRLDDIPVKRLLGNGGGLFSEN